MMISSLQGECLWQSKLSENVLWRHLRAYLGLCADLRHQVEFEQR